MRSYNNKAYVLIDVVSWSIPDTLGSSAISGLFSDRGIKGKLPLQKCGSYFSLSSLRSILNCGRRALYDHMTF